MTTAGLTSSEARQRLARYGRNELVATKKLSAFSQFLLRFRNPLVLLLIAAALVSGFLGDEVSAGIIILIVLVSVVLDFFNTYRSEQAAEKLKERVAVTATVTRDGKNREIPIAELVPGDLVTLTPGALVPADGTLVAANALFVNESSLTGESFPQVKGEGEEVYMGSSATTGDGVMRIDTTGAKTKYSHIVEALSHAEYPTDFDRSMKEFGYLIIKTTLVLVGVIFLANALNKADFLQSFLFATALAVGLTPELLPLIVTLNLTKGSLALAKRDIIVKRLSAIQNLGSMDVLCTDKTGTLTEDKIVLVKHIDAKGEDSADVLKFSYVSSYFRTSYHNPLDAAIKEFSTIDVSAFKKLGDIPFDYARKRDSIVAKYEGSAYVITKGAADAVMDACVAYDGDGTPFTGACKERAHATFEALSNDGFRVLGVAMKKLPEEKKTYGPADEAGMTFLGFAAFLDPAKTSVTTTLRALEEHGIRIKVLTGDNELVAKKVAHDIELQVAGVVTGAELAAMNESAFAHAVEENTIFARVSPDQKLHIIDRLQTNGHVVGFMGDGINDAPSLKEADVGISVDNAVDVSKEAADLIMLKKDLGDLVEGVVAGRTTFRNTLKYLLMELSSNFGNMFSMAGASLVFPFLPMLPVQILLNNLLYDASQFVIPFDCVDKESIKKPIRFDIRFVKRFMLVFGPVSSLFDFATFYLLFAVLHLTEHGFQTGWFLESIATQALVIFVIRTRRVPFFRSAPALSLVLSMIIAVMVGWGVALLPIGHLFGFTPLPTATLLAISAIVASYLVVVEVFKYFFYRTMEGFFRRHEGDAPHRAATSAI